MKPLRLAVGTSVLLDLAGEVDDVLDAMAVIARRLPDTDKLVLPSVLEELAFLAESVLSEQARVLAGKAMRQLRAGRQFRPLLELPVPAAEVEALADEFCRRELLPAEEFHDSMILAEAAMMSCGVLLSRDEHLRGIDDQELTWLRTGLNWPRLSSRRPARLPGSFSAEHS